MKSNLTPSLFNNLSLDERANLLWGPTGEGKFIESGGVYGKYRSATYLLNDLFVTVYYELYRNKITNILAWAKEGENTLDNYMPN